VASAPNIVPISQITNSSKRGSRQILLEKASNEFVFAFVGHAGSGTSIVASKFDGLLRERKLNGQEFDVEIIKAREVIQAWAKKRGKELPLAGGRKSVREVELLQNYGDEMRSEKTKDGEQDHAAVARGLALLIRQRRAKKLGQSAEGFDEIVPDGKPRAYILDSLRHQAEVHFLRRIYEDSFVLIGVVCEEEKRINRITTKYHDCGRDAAIAFMERDADAKVGYGQHVEKAFHLADFFVDNTVEQTLKGGEGNPDWLVIERLSRLVKIVTHIELIRPEIAETAMYHAHNSRMQSACLSRQVGAALVDRAGNVIAVGTNEVTKAGGGVYGESFAPSNIEARCGMFHDDTKRFCRNTREQNAIIQNVIDAIQELKEASQDRKDKLPLELRKTRIGELLEFSRAVHAEMDAMLSAARKGFSTLGCRLFVTTFPCHYCARHAIAAGIDEVQYLEPYRKSRALDLHDDAIQVESVGWNPPSQGGSKVLFRPFSGVAPSLYRRAFLKERDLKNNETGEMDIQEPDWGTPWHLPRNSYVQIEADLAKEESANDI